MTTFHCRHAVKPLDPESGGPDERYWQQVLELQATGVSFEAVPASTFEISPPAEAKVVNLTPAELKGPHGDATKAVGTEAVSAAVDFPLAAPQSLAGLPQSEVRAIEMVNPAHAL